MALYKWIQWLYFHGLGGSATMEYSFYSMSIVFSARLTSVSNIFVQFITYLITAIVWLVLALHLILSFGVYGATYYTLF